MAKKKKAKPKKKTYIQEVLVDFYGHFADIPMQPFSVPLETGLEITILGEPYSFYDSRFYRIPTDKGLFAVFRDRYVLIFNPVIKMSLDELMGITLVYNTNTDTFSPKT